MHLARTIQEMNGACFYRDFGHRLLRFIGAAILSLSLGGCLVSKQALVSEQGATFPLPAGTLIERVGADKPPLTLQRTDGYYTMVEPDGKETARFRMRPIGSNSYLVMKYYAKDQFPFTYGLARIANDDIEVFYVTSKNLEGYLTALLTTDPGKVRSIVSQLVSHNDKAFEVASLSFVEALLPEMLRKGFMTRFLTYRVLQEGGPAPSARLEPVQADPASEVDAIIARATADIVDQLFRHGDWVREEDGFRQMRLEFYSQAIFGYSVKLDRSACFFHFWRADRADDMMNRAYDEDCDGTVDAVQLFTDDKWKGRQISEKEKRFYAYYLPRYAALIKAANDYKSVNPLIGRLTLLPDLKAMTENRRILQRIVDAASGTSLMAVQRDGKERPRSDELLMQVWVNDGAEDGGFDIGFSATRAGGYGLKDCMIFASVPKGSEASHDDDCDGTPEGWTDVRGTHPVSAIGNEKVAQSLLLDMARFADVANAMFPPGEIVGDP